MVDGHSSCVRPLMLSDQLRRLSVLAEYRTARTRHDVVGIPSSDASIGFAQLFLVIR